MVEKVANLPFLIILKLIVLDNPLLKIQYILSKQITNSLT